MVTEQRHRLVNDTVVTINANHVVYIVHDDKKGVNEVHLSNGEMLRVKQD